VADRVVCTIADGVADVRLNRPDKLNALDMALFTALAETAAALAETPGVRAVVLSGEGRSFCAGLDLTAFSAMAAGERWRPPDNASGDPTTTGADGRSLGQRAVLAWYDLPVPVVAAVRGHALGGGLQLALGADIRLAAPDSVFTVFEINWGLTPDMAGTQLLPRLVGPDLAAELTYTGRMVEAAEADRIGLVTRVVDDPLAAAHTLAARIAAVNPDAIRANKSLLRQAHGAIEDGLAAERTAMGAIMGSPNQLEAAAAGLEKREPRFT
jgi:enoyl-CoA hydratase/carnithine racemase